MKVKKRGRTTEIVFENRRESAAVLRDLGMVDTAAHLDGIEDLAALPGMTTEAVRKLRCLGVVTLAELRAEDPKLVAYVAEVSATRVAQWQAHPPSPNAFLSDEGEKHE